MIGRTTAICAATAILGFAGAGAPASALPAAALSLGNAAPAITQTQTVQWGGGPYYGRGGSYYGGRHMWRSGQWRGNNWHGYRGRRGGDRWIGPAAGFAAGAILGGALSGAYARAPNDDAVAWCAQRYRSYDPASQTYMTYSGVRRSCP